MLINIPSITDELPSPLESINTKILFGTDSQKQDNEGDEEEENQSPSYRYAISKFIVKTAGRNLQEPPTTLGMLTIRIELSALPDTSNVVEQLNLIVVGGNSCAFKMVMRG